MRALNLHFRLSSRTKGDQVAISEQLPYDINADVIQVDDEDYGIWYMDVSERPEVYAGKKVRFKGQVLKNKYFKDKISFGKKGYDMLCRRYTVYWLYQLLQQHSFT